MKYVYSLLSCFFLLYPGYGQIRDGGIDPYNMGKGDWIFSIVDATNHLSGHVGSVTNENSLMLYYKGQGIRYISVKAATGTNLFGDCLAGPQFTSNLVSTAHANGILIFGYNRSYATNVAQEVAIADYVFNQGADGFIWDAEAEWESGKLGTNGPALAWAQCSTVRSNWPNKFLAHAPFAIIGVHTTFPYKEFGYWCDAAMPQIYHFSTAGLKKSPSADINWTDANWLFYQNSWASLAPTNIGGLTVYWTNAIKPLVPIQDVYGTGSVTICEGVAAAFPQKDVLEFLDYLAADPTPPTAGGYKGALFFRTDLRDSVQWDYVRSSTVGTFPNIVNNLVLDNTAATVSGSWSTVVTFSAVTTSSNTSPSFFGDGSGTDTNSFGTNYYSKGLGIGTDYVQFTPNIFSPGNYDVYQWHPLVTNATASASFVINSFNGSTTVFANQQTNAGNWSLLGRFYFAAGTNGYVRLTDSLASGVAIADGVKFVYVQPTNRVVINLNDSGPGSLRAAILASTNGDMITFSNGLSGTITLTSGELILGRDLYLVGPGAKTIRVSGNNASRVFNITNGTVTISGLTLSNGSSAGNGGGINNAATLRISASTLSSSTNGGSGGAIYNTGTLTVNGCTFSGNTSFGSGGAIMNQSGTVVAINSTFAQNATTDAGTAAGAIFNGNVLVLTNCTIVSNSTVFAAGGVYDNGTLATLKNTIIARNFCTNRTDIAGGLVSYGFNLIGDSSGGTMPWTSTDLIGAGGPPLDPRLGPLQDNGGPTFTMAPLSGSPAIDAGNSSGITTDQRGVFRYYDYTVTNASGGDASDIGAVELDRPVLNITSSANRAVLSWTAKNPGYTLEFTPVLFNPPATNSWSAVSGSPALLGGLYFITNSLTPSNRFYRLRSP